MKLDSESPKSWTDTIWNTLFDYRENCIPEHDSTYDEQWNVICLAMSYIEKGLSAQDKPNIPPKQIQIKPDYPHRHRIIGSDDYPDNR